MECAQMLLCENFTFFVVVCIPVQYNIRSEQYKKKKKKVDEMALSKVEQLNFQVECQHFKREFEVKAIF